MSRLLPPGSQHRRWIRRAGALLGALTLVGCATVGPDFRRPVVAAPVAWQAAQPHEGTPAALVDWWAQFNDPVLTGLIADADTASPTLAAAAGRIAEARAGLTVSEANRLPAVDGGVSVTRSGTERDTPVAARTTGAVAVDSAWEIDLFGRVQRSTEAAEARLAAREFEWHEARVSLAAEVASSYVNYRACRQLQTARADDVVSRTETDRMTGVAMDAGFTAPADGELARASLADARADLEDQRAQCEVNIKALVALVGLPEATLRERLDGRGNALPVPAAFAVDAVPLQVLSQRPDLAAAEQELAAASADIGVAEANRYPRLSLSGSISLTSVLTGGASTETLPWSIGPALSLPIFNGGARAAEVKAAEARLAQQQAAYTAAVRTAVREVEQAMVTLDSAQRREADARTAVEGYTRFVAATETHWLAGGVSLLSLEEARRSATTAQRKLITLRRDRVLDWISLYKAVGGGWTAPAGDRS
ncbi:MAG: efflux transporter outer membrane subunit [Denitromonas halophila]|nr:MAG: efflux transporter outer membrane subunit [Denitromonas halophila]TVT65567.1 MAG: efflux transporter outer membrane subunit [Denitromonas halophila]